MDCIPLLHADRVFTIFFSADLSFSEVRGILDQLLAEDAFNPRTQEINGAYAIVLQESYFNVWVSELNVLIQRC